MHFTRWHYRTIKRRACYCRKIHQSNESSRCHSFTSSTRAGNLHSETPTFEAAWTPQAGAPIGDGQERGVDTNGSRRNRGRSFRKLPDFWGAARLAEPSRVHDQANLYSQGRWSLPTGRASMGVPPPPRPPRRSIASEFFITTGKSGSPKIHDRLLLAARSGHLAKRRRRLSANFVADASGSTSLLQPHQPFEF